MKDFEGTVDTAKGREDDDNEESELSTAATEDDPRETDEGRVGATGVLEGVPVVDPMEVDEREDGDEDEVHFSELDGIADDDDEGKAGDIREGEVESKGGSLAITNEEDEGCEEETAVGRGGSTFSDRDCKGIFGSET